MKNNRIRIFYCLFYSFLLSTVAFSQTTTYSPYSVFGIGEIEYNDLGRNSGMGGVGFGLQSGQSLNRLNPASYSGLDSLTFTSEVSFSGKMSRYTNGRISQDNTLASFKKLAFGFRVTDFWATSFGLVPYSFAGYDITSQKQISGTPSNDIYNSHKTGDGAINKLYWGNAISLNKNFAVGFNASLNFGTLTQTEEISSSLFSSTSPRVEKRYLSNFNLDYGAQYTGKISDKYKFTLGGVFGLKNKLKFKFTETINMGSGEVENTENALRSSDTIPWFVGGGFSLAGSNGFTYAFDYYFQKWSGIQSKDKALTYVDNSRFSTGLEYRPNIRIPRNYFQRMFYQAGFTYNKSYLQLSGQQINDISVSAGLGLPVKGERSYFCVSFQAGKRGTITNGLIQEKYFQVNLNIVFRDIWFLKSKFD